MCPLLFFFGKGNKLDKTITEPSTVLCKTLRHPVKINKSIKKNSLGCMFYHVCIIGSEKKNTFPNIILGTVNNTVSE